MGLRQAGTSIAIKKMPNGIIQKPRIGRKPKIPPTIKSSPATVRIPGARRRVAQKLPWRMISTKNTFQRGAPTERLSDATQPSPPSRLDAKFFDFLVAGKATGSRLGKHQRTVTGDFEHTALPLNKIDGCTESFLQIVPHTEGPGTVVSADAVFDGKMHLTDFPVGRTCGGGAY